MAVVNLNKQVYNKNQYEKVIDTSFSQLTPLPPNTGGILPTISITDFFNAYKALFFQIPKLGDTDSHQYLIQTSAEYVGQEGNDELIQSLLEEINQLRQDNLSLEQQLLDIQTGTSNG